MSYHVNFEISTGTDMVSVADFNITSNVGGMFVAAFDPVGCDHGIKAIDALQAITALPLLIDAIERMAAAPSYFRLMNPANGCGDSLSAYVFLTKLRDACIEHPETTIWVSV